MAFSRKLLYILLLIVSIFVFVGCDPSVDPTLPTDPTDPTLPTNSEIATPSNVTIQEGVVSWTAVTGATGYVVLVGDARHVSTTTSFDLKTLMLEEGTYQIQVVAVIGTEESNPSTAQSYLVELSADADAVYAQVLSTMDETYVPDMTEDDFEDEWEFKQYVRMARLARVYSDAAVQTHMSETNAIGMFGYVFDMPNRMEDITTFAGFRTEISGMDAFAPTTEAVAFIVKELAKVAIDADITDAEEYLLELTEDKAYAEQQIALLYADPVFVEFLDLLELHLSTVDFETIEAWLFGEEEPWQKYSEIYTINGIIDYFDNIEYYSEAPYWLMETEIQSILFTFYDEMYQNDRTTFDAFILDTDDLIILLEEIIDYQDISWIDDSILETQMRLERMEELETLLTTQEALFLEAAETVIQYVVDVYNEIPNSLVTLIDSMMGAGTPEMAQILLLKNEVIAVLQETLPSAQDITLMYTALSHIMGVMTDVDVSTMLSYATFIGQFENLSADLFLEFVGGIDLVTVTDVMDLVDGMVTEGYDEYDPVEDMYIYHPTVVDYRKVLNLILYVEEYISNFKVTEQAKFDQLQTLMDSLDETELIELFVNAIFTQIEQDNGSSPMINTLKTLIVDDIDTFLAAVEVLKTMGVNVWDEFIETQAEFFFEIIDIAEAINNEEAPVDMAVIAQMIEDAFDDFVGYNSAIFAEMTPTQIETVLRVARIPVMMAFGFDISDTQALEDFDSLFNTLVTDVAQVIANFATLEQALVTYVDQSGFVFDFVHLLSGDEEFIPVAEFFFVNVDLFLTATIEDLIFDSIDIIFDDILGNEDLQSMIEVTPTDITSMKAEILDLFNQKLQDIRTYAEYDFENLTPEQITEIEMFFEGPTPVEPVV